MKANTRIAKEEWTQPLHKDLQKSLAKRERRGGGDIICVGKFPRNAHSPHDSMLPHCQYQWKWWDTYLCKGGIFLRLVAEEEGRNRCQRHKKHENNWHTVGVKMKRSCEKKLGQGLREVVLLAETDPWLTGREEVGDLNSTTFNSQNELSSRLFSRGYRKEHRQPCQHLDAQDANIMRS